ncbi:MAG: hypothetical protein N3E40_06340, partial [Dehalococcoidia bacterium]|nr:hypothetical protein [Dehalococcoidia bacterium]
MAYNLMNARRLWELQQIDLELESERAELERIRRQLGESDLLLATRARLAEDREHLAALERRQKETEAEIEELKAKLSRIKEKLYGGKTKNPKELMGFEQEEKQVAALIKAREDLLLDLMSQAEEYQARLLDDSRDLERVEADWCREQEALRQQEQEVLSRIGDLEERRSAAVAGLSPDILEFYRSARPAGGVVVVRVDRGRCQGCHISLSMAELQR